jgi:peptidoglycan/xylan/chitin deacetylase (PgdA/CDA1 family)
MAARIAAFGYHDVTREGERSGFERPGAKAYRFDRAVFQDHLRAIAMTVSSPTLVDEIALEESGQHTLLTFDDGGVSAFEVAGLLEEQGWRGHFFIVTSLIGAAGFLDKPYPPRHLQGFANRDHGV